MSMCTAWRSKQTMGEVQWCAEKNLNCVLTITVIDYNMGKMFDTSQGIAPYQHIKIILKRMYATTTQH